MMNLVILLLALCSAALPLFPMVFAGASEVVGYGAFNTGPFPCDGQSVALEVPNPGPQNFRVFRVRIWHGRDFGVIADYHSHVFRSGGSIVANFQQDAYAESTPRAMDTSYDGNFQTVAPGESLVLLTTCAQIDGPSGGRAHTVVTVFGEWIGADLIH